MNILEFLTVIFFSQMLLFIVVGVAMIVFGAIVIHESYDSKSRRQAGIEKGFNIIYWGIAFIFLQSLTFGVLLLTQLVKFVKFLRNSYAFSLE